MQVMYKYFTTLFFMLFSFFQISNAQTEEVKSDKFEKLRVSKQLLNDIKNANGVLWIGPHCDDELAATGLLLLASRKYNKDTYVFTFLHKPSMEGSTLSNEEKMKVRIKDNEEFKEFIGLKDYIRFAPEGFSGLEEYTSYSEKYKAFFPAMKKYIIKNNIDFIISFDSIQGWNEHPEHPIFGREVQKYFKKFEDDENYNFSHYCVLNANWRFSHVIPPTTDTDFIYLDDVKVEMTNGNTISLWEGYKEVFNIYKESLFILGKYYNNWDEFSNQTIHKELYEKIKYKR